MIGIMQGGTVHPADLPAGAGARVEGGAVGVGPGGGRGGGCAPQHHRGRQGPRRGGVGPGGSGSGTRIRVWGTTRISKCFMVVHAMLVCIDRLSRGAAAGRFGAVRHLGQHSTGSQQRQRLQQQYLHTSQTR